jgi:hypothetical protein
LCFSARSVTDKILAIVFPITAFVASGFEHSVANMYFIPYGMMLRGQPDVVAAAGLSAEKLGSLTTGGFLGNLIPVTIGNLIGGAIMVGVMYWFIYLREERKEETVVAAPQPAPAAMRPLALGAAEGETMKATIAEPRGVQLYSYAIASADMFYSEMNQRTIYVRDDPDTGFHIWGEIPGAGTVAAHLGQVLLEYAMTCAAQGNLPQAYRQMDTFGKYIGEALAVQIMQGTPAETGTHRAACALECVLESMGVPFTVEQANGELRYVLDHCPLCDTAEHTGIQQVELAHHALNALCRSLIRAIDPELGMRLPAKPRVDHIFSVLTPVEAEVASR